MTLISAARPHSRMPRVLSRLDQVIAEVLRELHASRRVFGELKLVRPQPALRVA